MTTKPEPSYADLERENADLREQLENSQKDYATARQDIHYLKKRLRGLAGQPETDVEKT